MVRCQQTSRAAYHPPLGGRRHSEIGAGCSSASCVCVRSRRPGGGSSARSAALQLDADASPLSDASRNSPQRLRDALPWASPPPGCCFSRLICCRIHTLLEEAENERMHLLTFMQLRQPGILFRAAVLGGQGEGCTRAGLVMFDIFH